MGGDYFDNLEQSRREKEQESGNVKENVPILNGAQIAAALEVMQSYSVGSIGKDAAVALLTASGVPSEAANNMVAKQKIKEPSV